MEKIRKEFLKIIAGSILLVGVIFGGYSVSLVHALQNENQMIKDDLTQIKEDHQALIKENEGLKEEVKTIVQNQDN